MTTNLSTFSSTTSFINEDTGGSRLLFVISDASCTGGVTAGDVIRYDDINSVYRKSIADNPTNSEVIGIVESVNIDGSKNVVIYGSINLPSSTIEDIPAGSTGAGGGEDIYFLSPTTSGKIRNTSPSSTNNIVKPIYQVAPHGSYTGIVTNYIGYKLPSDVTIFNNFNDTLPIGSLSIALKPLTTYGNSITRFSSNFLGPSDTTTEQEFISKYQYYFGKKIIFKFIPVAYGNFPLWDFSAIDLNRSYYSDTVDDVSITVPGLKFLDSTTFSLGIDLFVNFNQNDFPPYFIKDGLIKIGYVESGVDTVIGVLKITDILTDNTKVKLPGFNLLSKIQVFDQDNNTLFSNSFNYLQGIKIKNQSNINIIDNLTINNFTTKSYSINNNDLITSLNDFESRISTIETEINK